MYSLGLDIGSSSIKVALVDLSFSRKALVLRYPEQEMKIDSPQPVGAYTRTGGRAPAYCVATGKALLSELSDEALTPILKKLVKHSNVTITDPKVLRADLLETRKRGYSINKGEWRESVWGLAAVIRDSRNEPIAAVGVSGPDFRLSDPKRTAELGEAVKRYAGTISRGLGNRGPFAS